MLGQYWVPLHWVYFKWLILSRDMLDIIFMWLANSQEEDSLGQQDELFPSKKHMPTIQFQPIESRISQESCASPIEFPMPQSWCIDSYEYKWHMACVTDTRYLWLPHGHLKSSCCEGGLWSLKEGTGVETVAFLLDSWKTDIQYTHSPLLLGHHSCFLKEKKYSEPEKWPKRLVMRCMQKFAGPSTVLPVHGPLNTAGINSMLLLSVSPSKANIRATLLGIRNFSCFWRG